jgi:limonene-1,2-epoxide hydrolase
VSSAEKVIRDFMAASISAWATGDAAALTSFFSDDAEYCNGPLQPVRGRDLIIASLSEMMSMGGEVDVELIHLVSDGRTVMTERVDYVKLGAKTARLRIAGVFEIHSGVITSWRDYFDANEFSSQLSAD